MATDPELLRTRHCHDTQEFDTLKYVLSRVLSELDKDLVIKAESFLPHFDPSADKPNSFCLPTAEDERSPDEGETQSDHVIPVRKYVAIDGFCDKPLHERFASVQQSIVVDSSNEVFTKELREWLEAGDQHIPYELLSVPTGDILKMSFASISKRWVGEDRLSTLVQLLERATRTLVPSTLEQPDELTAAATAGVREDVVKDLPYTLTVESWDQWCDLIHRHDAGVITIAQAADSLRELHATGILNKSVQTFTTLSLPLLEQKFAHGCAEYVGIVSAVRKCRRCIETFSTQ